MAQQIPLASFQNSFGESIKTALSKLNWKHAIALAIPIGILLYPWPLVRAFLPVLQSFNKNHSYVQCQNHVQEIILTTNENLTIQNIKDIAIVKGIAPRINQFDQHESVTLALFRKNGKGGSTIFASQSIGALDQQTNNLFAETLWNSYRLSKLQNNSLKLVLIKSSEGVLQQFLLKFYKLNEKEIHKLGNMSTNKLHILRLDERVGTYEQLMCEFQSQKNMIFR